MAETIGMPTLGQDFFLSKEDVLCHENGRTYIFRSGSIGSILEEGIERDVEEILLMARTFKMQNSYWRGHINFKGSKMQI
jgi:predicted secreted hydrolase